MIPKAYVDLAVRSFDRTLFQTFTVAITVLSITKSRRSAVSSPERDSFNPAGVAPPHPPSTISPAGDRLYTLLFSGSRLVDSAKAPAVF